MHTSIIKAESVSKTVSTNQEQLTILEKVDIDIVEGETVAIVGTSGAGKSTLMTLLAGLDVPSSGEIHLLNNLFLNLTMSNALKFAVNQLDSSSKAFY